MRTIIPYIQGSWAIFCIACVITLYGLFTKHDSLTSPLADDGERNPHYIGDHWTTFMDLQVMVFVGFGFLYVFLRAHSWASIAFNWLAGSWAFLIGILWLEFWSRVFSSNFEHNKIKLDIKMLVEGSFCAASILIAYGAVLGKLNAY